VQAPALNSTVNVYMYYTDTAGRIAEGFVHVFNLD